VRMQCSPPGTYAGPVACLMQTIRAEGPRALYKGASCGLVLSLFAGRSSGADSGR